MDHILWTTTKKANDDRIIFGCTLPLNWAYQVFDLTTQQKQQINAHVLCVFSPFVSEWWRVPAVGVSVHHSPWHRLGQWHCLHYWRNNTDSHWPDGGLFQHIRQTQWTFRGDGLRVLSSLWNPVIVIVFVNILNLVLCFCLHFIYM